MGWENPTLYCEKTTAVCNSSTGIEGPKSEVIYEDVLQGGTGDCNLLNKCNNAGEAKAKCRATKTTVFTGTDCADQTRSVRWAPTFRTEVRGFDRDCCTEEIQNPATLLQKVAYSLTVDGQTIMISVTLGGANIVQSTVGGCQNICISRTDIPGTMPPALTLIKPCTAGSRTVSTQIELEHDYKGEFKYQTESSSLIELRGETFTCTVLP